MTSAANTSPTASPAKRTLADRMQPTTRAGAAAHAAFLGHAIDGARWERRGVLGRLRRIDP